MNEQVTVNVTADHIARGNPCIGASCPIALAVVDSFPGEYVRAWAYPEWIYLIRGANADMVIVPAPESVEYFIHAFDDPARRDLAVPFQFVLDLSRAEVP